MQVSVRAVTNAVLVVSIAGLSPCVAQVGDQDLAKIETVVVIYAENRSFDLLYGRFPGANGIDQATDDQKTQVDHDGTPLRHFFCPASIPEPAFANC